MTRAELEQWEAAVVAAWRLNVIAGLREMASLLASRLRPAAVSRERLRAAVSSLDGHRSRLAERMEVVLEYHAMLAGAPDPPAAGRAAAEQLATDFIEESRRTLQPLLEKWPGNNTAGVAALERVIERWPTRAERIADGFVRELKGD